MTLPETSAGIANAMIGYNKLPISGFVEARERLVWKHQQYLKALPTDTARIEARRQGIGPVLPHIALSSNAPNMMEIMAAYNMKKDDFKGRRFEEYKGEQWI